MTEVLTGMNFDTGSSGEGAVVLDKQTYSNPIDSYWMAKKGIEEIKQRKLARQQFQQQQNEQLLKDLNVNSDGSMATDIPELLSEKQNLAKVYSEYTRKNGITPEARNYMKPLYDALATKVSGSKVQNDHIKGELARLDAASKADNNIDVEKSRQNILNYNNMPYAERIKIGTPPLLATRDKTDVQLFVEAAKGLKLEGGADKSELKGGYKIKKNEFGDTEGDRVFGVLEGNPDFVEKNEDEYFRWAQLNPKKANEFELEAKKKGVPARQLYFKEVNPQLWWSTPTDYEELTSTKEAIKSKYDIQTAKGKAKAEIADASKNWQRMVNGQDFRSEYPDENKPLVMAVKPYYLGQQAGKDANGNPIRAVADDKTTPIQTAVVGREIIRKDNGEVQYKLELDSEPFDKTSVVNENGTWYKVTTDDKLAFNDIWEGLSQNAQQAILTDQAKYSSPTEYMKWKETTTKRKILPNGAQQKAKTESKKPKLDY